MKPTPIKNAYWVEEGRLLAGEYPGAQEPDVAAQRVGTLLDAGVQVFIDLTGAGELASYNQFVAPPAEHFRFAIQDVSVPDSPDVMVAILDQIDTSLAAHRLAYVHCWGGVGRTGTVIGCWLARRMGGPAGLAKLNELWRHCPKSASRESPETAAQRGFVRRWIKGR